MHPSRNLIWTRSLLKVGFYLFHWDPNAVKVEFYLKQLLKLNSPYFLCSLCSSCCIQCFMKVTLYIYALQWHVKWRIMLYGSVRKGLHWHNPYLNIAFIYTCTVTHNPYSHSCTGYTGRNYMYLGVGII